MNNFISGIILKTEMPDWFIWWGIEAHKIILPITGIIGAYAVIRQMMKTRKIVNDRQYELNQLSEQTGELSKVSLGMNEQLDELRGHSELMNNFNKHLLKSVEYQSELLNAFLEDKNYKELKDKLNRRPYFESYTNISKRLPNGITIGIINTGETAQNVLIAPNTGKSNLLKMAQKITQVSKSSSIEISLKTDDYFDFTIEFEDVLGVKYSQKCLGSWFSYHVYGSKEL